MPEQTFPPGYVPFADVRESLPEPRRVQVSESVALETLHLPGPDPPIVFVHGGLGSLWNPYPQLAAFEGERELVAYALAGNGNSTARPEQSLDGHVADLRDLLDELGVDRPIVHGHSYGTAVAIEYAKRHPTAGVVLHAGGDHDLTPAWEKPLLRLFLTLRLYRFPANDALVRQLAYSVGFHDETSRAVVEDFLQSNPLPHRRSAWTTVTEAFWGYDGRSDVDRVDVPTLVVHGPADGIVPVRVARETAGRLPDSVFCRVQRTGHVAMIERPSVYNSLLRAHVQCVRDGRDIETAVRDWAREDGSSTEFTHD
ncbi:alpha/beta fold hydrolase [Halomicrobium urmianum]|uniref:alpha/beta fold hydrolase n=1 Tax=Halomicrobium urmianum TaxID=1586233 RepID=UPI001CD97AE4|nr:alpha/beta hydrolase [Halomicrobium urmianum]